MQAITLHGITDIEGGGEGYQIENFDAFLVRDNCIAFIYVLSLPNGADAVSELKKAKEFAKQKFKVGKKRGVVKEVLLIRSHTIGDTHGNVYEWVGNTEKPLKYAIDTSWHLPKTVNALLNISAHCTKDGLVDGKREVLSVVESASVEQ